MTDVGNKVDRRMCPNYSPAGLGPFLSFSCTRMFYLFIIFPHLIWLLISYNLDVGNRYFIIRTNCSWFDEQDSAL